MGRKVILTCLPLEARVLADMICNPDALKLCDEVESADFVDMRHVVILNAIRDVQEQQAAVDVDAVVEAIRHRAIEHGSPAMAEKVGYEFIGDLITRAPKSNGTRTIRADVLRLRRDRDFRESLIRGVR
jgi:hypothetical protein